MSEMSDDKVFTTEFSLDWAEKGNLAALPGFTIKSLRVLAAEVRRLQAENARLRPEAGHVIDENGVKRRVLGTLPLTADGCVVIDQPVYHPTFGQMYVWKDGKGTWRAKGWLSDYKQAAPLTDCYASHDAAKEARNGEGDK